MRVLVADDEPISRHLLKATLERMGCEVVEAADGASAWALLQEPSAPRLVVLDWMMPGLDGVDICRRVRQRQEEQAYTYIVLITGRGAKEDIVAGLDSGADDYVVKPVDAGELRSRLAVGQRILRLEAALAGKVHELEHALRHVKQLQGLLPICMHCRKIRDDDDTWLRLESYVEQHADVMFTHSLCSECRNRHYPELTKA